MRLLVFGAGGQLGQELMNACREAGIVAIGLHRQAGGDIGDAEQVESSIASTKPSIVVNGAAYTKVDKAESQPDVAYRENSLGPAIIAQCCNRLQIPVIHLSTDYVFSGDKLTPYLESDPVSPLGVYGTSKEQGERAIRSALEHHIILRTAWVYGVYGQNFLRTMLRFAQTKDEWSVVADQWGNPTSTKDLAYAIITAAKAINDGENSWGTYHFAGTGDASWFEFATEIIAAQARITGRLPVLTPIETSAYPTAARRPKNSRLNSNLFADTFGFRAKTWQERVIEATSVALAQ
jgi:dTDP-4-dehydrorhamnose reductase